MDVCRACMCTAGSTTTTTNLQPIFVHNIPDLFYEFTQVKIKWNDGLPSVICSNCLNALNECNSFKIKCLETDHRLRKKFTEINDHSTNIHEPLSKVNHIITTGYENVKTEDYRGPTEITTEYDIEQVKVEEINYDYVYDNIISYYNLDNHHRITSNKISHPSEFDDDKVGTTSNLDLKDNVDIQNDNNIFSPTVIIDVDTTTTIKDENKQNIGIKDEDIHVIVSKSSNTDLIDEPIKKRQRNRHNKNRIWICDICNKPYYEKYRIRAHLRTHLGLKPHECKMCDKSYNKRSDLDAHINKLHTNVELQKRYNCNFPECSQFFYGIRGLTTHKRTVHNVNNRMRIKNPKVICELCGKSYERRADLNTHINKIHLGDGLQKKFECNFPECGKTFYSGRALSVHKRNVHTVKNKRVICEICGKSISSKTELKRHTYTHTKLTPHKCTMCLRTFPTSYKLKVHISRHEDNKPLRIRSEPPIIKPYPCPYCVLSFDKPGILKYHIMTHTGEKPHGCISCGKRFIKSYSLKLHIKKVHNKLVESQ